MDIKDGALPEGTSQRKARGGPARVTRIVGLSEYGGSMKVEERELKSPHHEKKFKRLSEF